MVTGTANRTIVKYGIYQFTQEERESVRLRIQTSVIREPSVEYLNYKFQKPKGFYGYYQLMGDDYVIQSGEINFIDQVVYEFVNHQLIYTQLAQCINLNTYNVVAALASGLGATFIIGEPSPFNVPPIQPDRIIFKLFSNTTLVVNVAHEVLADYCGFPPTRDQTFPDYGTHNSTPPEENPDDPGFDIGTPPYDAGTQDNGETYVPEPGTPEPDYPDARVYNWTLMWHYYDQPSVHRTATGSTTGPLYAPRVERRAGSSSGTKNMAIAFDAGSPPAVVTVILETNVPLSEPDAYFIIESFTAT